MAAPMDHRTLETRVLEIIADVMNIDLRFLSDGAALEDLAIDSLMLMEIGLAVEERFNVELRVKDFDNARTVSDVIELIRVLVARTKDGAAQGNEGEGAG